LCARGMCMPATKLLPSWCSYQGHTPAP
jgi:hypothetical protein